MDPLDDFEAHFLHYAVAKEDISVVRALIADGADVNLFDELGHTPMHYAVEEGRLDVVDELLQAGADINAHSESDISNTPLARVAGNCSFELAKALVDRGADPTIEGWMRRTALDRKKEEGRRVFELLTKVAKHEYRRPKPRRKS